MPKPLHTLTIAEQRLFTCPSMERQPYCCLPWCGKTGKIDEHHVIPKRHTIGMEDKGPVVYPCHACHMRHHHEHRIEWDYAEGWTADGRRCVTREVEPA